MGEQFIECAGSIEYALRDCVHMWSLHTGRGCCVQVGTVWTLFCARASSLRKPNPQFSSVQVRTLNAISKKFNYEHVCALPHDTPNRMYPMFTYSLSYSSAYLRSLALYTWRWKSMLTIIARRWWSAHPRRGWICLKIETKWHSFSRLQHICKFWLVLVHSWERFVY